MILTSIIWGICYSMVFHETKYAAMKRDIFKKNAAIWKMFSEKSK